MTTGSELLLVSRTHLDALQKICQRHDIPLVQRYDVWSDLLDPFLDTEFSLDSQKANIQRLKEHGSLTDDEIIDLRKKVEGKMVRHTALTWEWQHYGLADLLAVMKPKLGFGRERWAEFYGEVMEISLRGMKSRG